MLQAYEVRIVWNKRAWGEPVRVETKKGGFDPALCVGY